MKVSVKELRRKRIEIEVTDFDLTPGDQLETNLILIFRHVSRFDINNRKLMRLDGSIKIYELKICQKKVNTDMRILRYILNAGSVSLWTKGNKVEKPFVTFYKGVPGFKIVYGCEEWLTGSMNIELLINLIPKKSLKNFIGKREYAVKGAIENCQIQKAFSGNMAKFVF